MKQRMPNVARVFVPIIVDFEDAKLAEMEKSSAGSNSETSDSDDSCSDESSRPGKPH